MNFGQLAHHLATSDQYHLVLLDRSSDVQQLYEAYNLFANKDLSSIIFPDRDTIPYSREFIPDHIIYERFRSLSVMLHDHPKIVFSTIRNALLKLPPKGYIELMVRYFQKGDPYSLEKLCYIASTLDYQQVNEVLGVGDFNRLGNLLEIQTPNGRFRIEWDDDVIDHIWKYDFKEQKYFLSEEKIHLFPCKEVILNQEQRNKLCQYWCDIEDHAKDKNEYKMLSEGIPIEGLYELLPLIYDQLSTILDYFKEQPTIWLPENYQLVMSQYHDLLQENIEKNTHLDSIPSSKPADLLAEYIINTNYKKYVPKDNQTDQHIDLEFIKAHPENHFLISCSSSQRAIRCHEYFKDRQIKTQIIKDFHQEEINKSHISIIEGNCHWQTNIGNITVLPDYHYFAPKMKISENKEGISSISQLKVNDYVIHEDHGVAIYQGLKELHQQEFIILKFAQNDQLYVSIDQFHLISPYKTDEHLELNRLGSKSWSKTKSKAKKITYDYAAEILKIQAMKENTKGHQYAIPSEYSDFCNDFCYKPTHDQKKCFKEIELDMQSPKVMDRLICGDVGFGKTEVAMRAAFIAVYNKTKVLILTPTTLLAKQHLSNFLDRFSKYPVNISLLTASEKNTSLDRTDIVIATHAAIRRIQQFSKLGLLIIDEEHRFGVKDKEAIRAKFPAAETLSMSATPIPRSLNFALSALRDISLITTPPVNRQEIITKIYEESEAMIIQALQREFHRGGQVYYIHNDISTINKVADYLETKHPHAQTGVLHGRMKQADQDKVMYAFSMHHINLLVTTTVVESGIDIHNANTIIITRSDKFGLSQLHQLRGRVGRGKRQAYAYFLVPNYQYLTKNAKLRLKAIEYLKSLGSGYHLAVQDLEIRGGGSILGKEQSGVIKGIGYDLYLSMLKQACKSLSITTEINIQKTQLTSCINMIIPNDYIEDTNIRLEYYQKIADCVDAQLLARIQKQLQYNYGAFPKSVEYLMITNDLLIKLSNYHAIELKIMKNAIIIQFQENNDTDNNMILDLHSKINVRYRPNNSIEIPIKDDHKTKIEELNKIF